MIKSIHWDLPEYTYKQTHNKYCKSQSVTSNFHMHSVSLHLISSPSIYMLQLIQIQYLQQHKFPLLIPLLNNKCKYILYTLNEESKREGNFRDFANFWQIHECSFQRNILF